MNPRRNDKCPCGSGRKHKKSGGKHPTEDQKIRAVLVIPAKILANPKEGFEIGDK